MMQWINKKKNVTNLKLEKSYKKNPIWWQFLGY